MKRFFVIIFAALGLSTTLSLTSCDRPKPPDYDESKSQTLGKVCRFLQEEQFAQAIATLQKTDAAEHLFLLETLSERQQELELLRQANELLGSGRYQELNLLVEQAEKRGIASPDLLEYRSAPQALQALQVFCSRMPWEKAADLANAMKWLHPYLPTLRQASKFEDFWQQQNEQLEEISQKHFVVQQQRMLENIDLVLGSNQPQAAWNEIEKLYQGNPEHKVFMALDQKQKKLQANFLALAYDQGFPRPYIELALALTWPDLNKQQQEQLKLLLEQTTTLSGSILAAQLFETPEYYALAVQRWQAVQGNRKKAAWFLEKALSEIFFHADQFNARCWRSPCPNLTDFFARINQIAVNLNHSQDKERR